MHASTDVACSCHGALLLVLLSADKSGAGLKVDIGPTHNIFLSPYIDYRPGSDQYDWFLQRPDQHDRTVTPWVTVSFLPLVALVNVCILTCSWKQELLGASSILFEPLCVHALSTRWALSWARH